MKYLLTLSILTLTLTGCDLMPVKENKNTEPAEVKAIMEEAPLTEAREAVLDENGEILSTEENMWRNRDENVDSRS